MHISMFYKWEESAKGYWSMGHSRDSLRVKVILSVQNFREYI